MHTNGAVRLRELQGLAVEGHQRLHRIFRLRDLHEQQQAFRDQPSCIVVLSRPRNGPFFSTRSELLQHASGDRKSTRLNSSHRCISYAVFCLKKKNSTDAAITNSYTTTHST